MKENTMVPQFFIKMKPVDPVSYEDFIRSTSEDMKHTNPDELKDIERKYYDYKKINLQRTRRLAKQYSPSNELIRAINEINTPQFWLVITESWCGDSAQNLPIIAKAAALSKNIQLIIIPRDKNPHIMDNYLTNGSRSIPVLIAFDSNGNELFKWGPRPKEAQELVTSLKNEGLDKKEINTKLHLWYARNKGRNIEKELINLLTSINIQTATPVQNI